MSQANLPHALHYADDRAPGIRRRRAGRGWSYSSADGTRLTDRGEIERLNRIALPPAYTDAWFSPDPQGHIQATGVDEKGRKQYRYHLEFRAAQEAAKYERLAAFGRALPRLRRQVDADLAGRKLTRDTVVAAVVRLLDLGHIRIGNTAYAKANKSFGATTLRNRHARITGGELRLDFKGKSGKQQRLVITDARLARLTKRLQDLPGQQLFQYFDEDGERHTVDSAQVNGYIQAATDGPFTAKHFRTWSASAIAFSHLLGQARETGKLSIKAMLEPVAAALGNTPAISRKSYVHPALIELCKAGQCASLVDITLPRRTRYLSPEERGLIGFLDELAAVAEQAAADEASAALDADG